MWTEQNQNLLELTCQTFSSAFCFVFLLQQFFFLYLDGVKNLRYRQICGVSLLTSFASVCTVKSSDWGRLMKWIFFFFIFRSDIKGKKSHLVCGDALHLFIRSQRVTDCTYVCLPSAYFYALFLCLSMLYKSIIGFCQFVPYTGIFYFILESKHFSLFFHSSKNQNPQKKVQFSPD